MRHISEGDLRRFVDEPFALNRSQQSHLASCSRCAGKLVDISADKTFAADVLGHDPSPADVVSARRKLGARTCGTPIRTRLSFPRVGLAPRVAAVVLPALLITGIATGALHSVLTVFQPNQPVPINLARGDLSGLLHLRHLGEFHRPQHGAAHRAQTLSAARRASGLTVLTPGYLPSGTPSHREYQVLPAQSASFRFDADKASRYALRHHLAYPAMPPLVNGTRVSVQTHAAVVTIFGAASGIPDLVVGQTPAPTLTVRGAALKTIESYLSSVPGVPRHLMSQLESLANPTSALPIPVPVNWAYGHRVTIQGSPGVLVGDNTGVATVVIWEKHHVVYGVGGEITSDQAIKIAESLH